MLSESLQCVSALPQSGVTESSDKFTDFFQFYLKKFTKITLFIKAILRKLWHNIISEKDKTIM